MRCGICPVTFCQYRRTDGECLDPYETRWGDHVENLEEFVKKHAESPISGEKIEFEKKVWKAHEKAVLEPFLAAAKDLVDAVERYVEPKPGQEFVHRSEILLKKNALKKLL